MYGLNAGHLLIVLAIILVLFGPKQLPKLGQMIGKTMKGIQDGASGKGEDPEAMAKAEATSADEAVKTEEAAVA
jgi:sec-independent protein translocase protein TatA